MQTHTGLTGGHENPVRPANASSSRCLTCRSIKRVLADLITMKLTSTWHDHERVQLQAAGFDDFVFKPVDRRALSKIMGLSARKRTTDS